MPEVTQINFPIPVKAGSSSLKDSSETRMIPPPCTEEGGTRRSILAKMDNPEAPEGNQDHSYFN